MTGTVFDIKEFSVHDGPGARITVFLKGCPLRCQWCHNPEGLSPSPQLLYKKHLCTGCGSCLRASNSENARKYGRDPLSCPNGLLSVSGTEYTPEGLLEKLRNTLPMVKMMEGGVTFSGGEPLLQSDFLKECIALLHGADTHVAVETSGYAASEVFRSVANAADLVIMDLKLMDPEAHLRYTGKDNRLILQNAAWLKESGHAHLFRTPLIPGITDTEANRRAVQDFIGNSPWETIPYNPLAGAKYPYLGMKYEINEGEQ